MQWSGHLDQGHYNSVLHEQVWGWCNFVFLCACLLHMRDHISDTQTTRCNYHERDMGMSCKFELLTQDQVLSNSFHHVSERDCHMSVIDFVSRQRTNGNTRKIVTNHCTTHLLDRDVHCKFVHQWLILFQNSFFLRVWVQDLYSS